MDYGLYQASSKGFDQDRPVGVLKKVSGLLDIISIDPFRNPPKFEKLIGDLEGAYSRRINIQHRLVYSVDEGERVVKVISMWTHYE
jgi:Txe/YoeB family toxin of toxin-antitoxin system